MRGKANLIGALVVVCLLGAQITAQDSGAPVTGNLIGRIVGTDGRPVGAVALNLSGMVGRTATSTRGGWFLFEGLPAGLYSIRGVKDGWNARSSTPDGSWKVPVGRRTENVELTLERSQVIEGTVSDSWGSGVPFIDVLAINVVEPFPDVRSYAIAANARTDDQGKYTFRSLSRGDYIIAAAPFPVPLRSTEPPYVGRVIRPVTYWPSGEDVSSASVIKIGGGSAHVRADVFVRAAKAFRVEGVAPASAAVRLRRTFAGAILPARVVDRTVRASGDGSFAFDGVSAGNYLLVMSADGNRQPIPTGSRAVDVHRAAVPPAPVQVSVADGDISGLRLGGAVSSRGAEPVTGQPRRRIAGVVRVAGTQTALGGVEIALRHEQSQTDRAITNHDGRFVVTNLLTGAYTVTVLKAGYLRTDDRHIAPRELRVVLDAADLELAVTMVQGATITGEVQAENGEPIAAATIRLLRSVVRNRRTVIESIESTSAMVPITVTDIRGAYRFVGLPPGDYVVEATGFRSPDADDANDEAAILERIRVLRGGRDDRAIARRGAPSASIAGASVALERPRDSLPVYFPGTPIVGQAETISASLGQTAWANLVVRSVSPSQVIGMVYGQSGPWGSAVSVELVSPQGSPTKATPQLASVDRNGAFVFDRVPPGPHRIVATGRLPEGQSQWAMAELFANPGSVQAVQLTMRPAQTVSGQVVGGAGRRNVLVSLQPAGSTPKLNRWLRGSVSDEGGAFAIDGVLPGEYELSVLPAPDTTTPSLPIHSLRVGGRDLAGALLIVPAEGQTGNVLIVLSGEAATPASPQR